jgi:predicted RNA-binding protein
MCQATVFLDGDKILEDVIEVRPTENGVELSTLFEEPRTVKAAIRDIDLLKHTVHLDSLDKAEEKT